MNKDRLYQLTFLSLISIVYTFGYFSMEYLLKISTQQFLSVQIEGSKREAKEIASLIFSQVENNISKDIIVKNLQKSIEKTDVQNGFVCMFDWSAKEICHPNIEKIGKMVGPDESYVSGLEEENNAKDFYEYLRNKSEGGGIRDFKDPKRESEIIYLYPVKNTDWIIASHANIKHINEQIDSLRFNFILVYSITSSLIVLFSFFITRFIGSKYEKRMEENNENLSNELVNISKLNQDLLNYKTKQSIKEKEEEDDELDGNSENKKRILTHLRNEIITLEIDDIAYVYLENTITYIKDKNGKVSNSNNSLDDFFEKLDSAVFFRANRQFIISIKSISKIVKYGNNQLKIEVLPVSQKDIIISKNKVSEFKNWLNK